MKAEEEAFDRGEQERVPEICTRCGHYKPTFYRIQHKECAVFTTVGGVKDNRCGAYEKAVYVNGKKR